MAISTPDGQTDVSGALPAGWGDNSTGSWQPIMAIRYAPLADGDRRYLRIDKLRGGNLQLAHPLPDFTTETFCRLTITARTLGIGAPEFGIRFNSAPYTMPWQVAPLLTNQWADYVYDFRIDAQPQSIRLQISHGGVGAFDLQRVRLERFTRDELIQQIQAAHPEGGSGNLVTITRFPLGLPSGWCLDRDDDDAQILVTGDPANLGPSGAPALRVAAPGNFRLRTAPFAVPWSFERHTLSLSLKSAQPGRLVIIGVAGRYIAEQRFARRRGLAARDLHLPAGPARRGAWARDRGRRRGLALDGLQVERGPAATRVPSGAALRSRAGLPAVRGRRGPVCSSRTSRPRSPGP